MTYDQFVAECAKQCRNCMECGQERPCGACLAGGICDAFCDCDDYRHSGLDGAEDDWDDEE